tara:strand:+ start:25 stop:333 length:309 start_codon:yes stop_codon:yes gene_type:complete
MTTDFKLGRYRSTRKLGTLPTKRLTGRVVFLTSLGSVGRWKGKTWSNYPTGSPEIPFRKSLYKILRVLLVIGKNRIGTLQGQLRFWKGQKREPIGGYNERTT